MRKYNKLDACPLIREMKHLTLNLEGHFLHGVATNFMVYFVVSVRKSLLGAPCLPNTHVLPACDLTEIEVAVYWFTPSMTIDQ